VKGQPCDAVHNLFRKLTDLAEDYFLNHTDDPVAKQKLEHVLNRWVNCCILHDMSDTLKRLPRALIRLYTAKVKLCKTKIGLSKAL